MFPPVLDSSEPARWAVQFANGDRSIGDRLGQHVRYVLRRRLSAIGLSPQDLEDLVQDCAAHVFSSIRDFDSDKGNLDAWLSGFARNVARSWWRGRCTTRQVESTVESLAELPSGESPNLAGSGSLEAALSELHPLDQELLQLRFGFGCSFNEIAQVSDLTPVNARKRVSRAVEALRHNRNLRLELGFGD